MVYPASGRPEANSPTSCMFAFLVYYLVSSIMEWSSERASMEEPPGRGRRGVGRKRFSFPLFASGAPFIQGQPTCGSIEKGREEKVLPLFRILAVAVKPTMVQEINRAKQAIYPNDVEHSLAIPTRYRY